MEHYTALSPYLKRRFGCKVYKLALDGGFTCPNRDGAIDTRGCIFCAGDGSGVFAADRALDIPQQIEAAKARVASKNGGGKYIAYFRTSRTLMAVSRTWSACSYRRLRRRMWSRSRSPRGRTVCRMKPLRSCGG